MCEKNSEPVIGGGGTSSVLSGDLLPFAAQARFEQQRRRAWAIDPACHPLERILIQINTSERVPVDNPRTSEGSEMNWVGQLTDQSGGRGEPPKPGHEPDREDAARRRPVDNRGQEQDRRRNRRAQHKDQLNQWRKKPGACWPAPVQDDSETK